jgi:hypothetical protein
MFSFSIFSGKTFMTSTMLLYVSMKCAKNENEWIEENKYLIVLLGKVLMDRPLMKPFRESKEWNFSEKNYRLVIIL